MNRFTPNLESLDERINLSASPQPVLMVLADQRDFNIAPKVAEAPRTMEMGDGSVKFISINIANAATPDHSAIVFVGGWGSSMYQY